MTNQIALFSYSVNVLDVELRSLKTLRPKVMLLNKKCYSGLWLHHTAHYTEKMLHTCGRVLCQKKGWDIGDLAVKRPWLALGGPTLALAA